MISEDSEQISGKISSAPSSSSDTVGAITRVLGAATVAAGPGLEEEASQPGSEVEDLRSMERSETLTFMHILQYKEEELIEQSVSVAAVKRGFSG